MQNIGLWVCSAALCLSGCSGLRSEFYRAEVDHRYKSATQAYQAQNMDQARHQFEQLLALDPTCARAHVGLGHISLVAGDYPAACDHYDKALHLNPSLETTITPHLMRAQHQRHQSPLLKQGVRLSDIAALLHKGQITTIEKRLAPGVPLDLLATDTGSVPLTRLESLTQQIKALAQNEQGAPRWRLFMAHYLAATHDHDRLALDVAEAVLPHLAAADLPHTHRLRGLLYQRLNRPNQAVTAYLRAVETGAPINSVSHLLAHLYGVPVQLVEVSLASPPQQKSSGTQAHAAKN